MISYDDFCKLPIFKKGYVAMNGTKTIIWWHSEKPEYDGFCWYGGQKMKTLDFPDSGGFDIDTTGIDPAKSLREVGK